MLLILSFGEKECIKTLNSLILNQIILVQLNLLMEIFISKWLFLFLNR